MNSRTIVISGGGGYLGAAIAERFLSIGFRVVSLEKNTSSENFRIERISTDISDERSVSSAAEKIRSDFGEVFAVIHAASAPLARKKLLEIDSAEFESQYRVNVFGAFYLAKYFSPIIAKEGCFIGISSSAVQRGSHAKSGSYSAAKIALGGFLRILSNEAPFRVYAAAPAFMPGGLNGDLPANAAKIFADKDKRFVATTPEAVASEIEKLVSDTEGKIRGKIIFVPGESKDL